jgi:hypothetical protein
MRRARAQVDDPPSGLPEARKHYPAAVEYADQVDHDVLSPGIWITGLQCSYRLDNAGVVHEDVDPTVVLERRLSQPLGVGVPRDIGGYDLRSSSLRMAAATGSQAFSVRAARRVAAPPRASSRATARPIPRLAPVTIATFPVSTSLPLSSDHAGAYSSSGVRAPLPAAMLAESLPLCFAPLAGGSR